MGYVRTAGMSTAARRARRRAALVIVAVLLGLLLVFGFALAYMQGWVTLPGGDRGGDEATATSAPPVATVTPAEVSVNVFNAGGIPGAAGRAGEALRARGFAVATVANDPEGADVPGIAILRHGPTGIEEAQLLQASLPEGVELVADTRSSSSVDLVLGEQWEDLPAPDAAATEEG
ncbi:hypothetical protein GCM10009584_04320 [Ornithinimicrobium humiphilum]|uniref:LytR cell envelope-related transcriptional attenuator n=1 Tax=Ornithinimicrobium humiphilum TaxID=125288 RepID=A0A543K7W8_9MICO|nr:LytR C-terminal domain-containing protein [Ornithinimicrobium humiphilum]TQM91160.1 LytR cell envelope-related transcriptional attenuator [Ornithinimicrobium humiphilum]